MAIIGPKISVTVLILAALFFSGCQSTTNGLKPAAPTEQVRTIDQLWQQTGNVFSKKIIYDSPGGQEENTFKLTVIDGVVTAVEVAVTTTIDASISYQRQFATELPKLIVGKKLADLPRFDRISGASLTTAVFDQAVSQLKNQI